MLNKTIAKRKIKELKNLVTKARKEREKLDKIIDDRTKDLRIKRNQLTRRINILETWLAKTEKKLACQEELEKMYKAIIG